MHLIFDRPVLDVAHAVLVERGTQWLFRKDPEGRKVHAVVSAADDWVDLAEADIVRRVQEDLVACFPTAADARIVSARAVKEKRATFAATPEFEACRPDASSHSEEPEGVLLAGDYTRTGWPATMEGAARSGAIAAGSLLDVGARALLPSELKPAGLSGVLVRGLPGVTRS